MEIIVELLKILLPAALVLYAMFLVVRSFLKREMDKKFIELKTKNEELVLPIRLQAYERMCLFLERMSPSNLVVRVNEGGLSAKELQHKLIFEIREELNHNLSQQLYMSDEVWQLIKNATEELIMIINDAAGSVAEEANGTDLAKRVFELILERKIDVFDYALAKLKDEIRIMF